MIRWWWHCVHESASSSSSSSSTTKVTWFVHALAHTIHRINSKIRSAKRYEVHSQWRFVRSINEDHLATHPDSVLYRRTTYTILFLLFFSICSVLIVTAGFHAPELCNQNCCFLRVSLPHLLSVSLSFSLFVLRWTSVVVGTLKSKS